MSSHYPKPALDSPLPKGGRVSLAAPCSNLLFLRLTPATSFRDVASYAISAREWDDKAREIDGSEQNGYTLRTGSLDVRIGFNPFRMVVKNHAGVPLFETAQDALRFEQQGTVLRTILKKEEAVYGLGEFGETFNRNPGRYRFWNTDDPSHQPFSQFYCQIPFALCHGGGALMPRGLFLDNPGEAIFDIGFTEQGIWSVEARTGEIQLWLLFQESPAKILSAYSDLTGRMERPPLWSLGYQQCRWSYMSESRVREVAREFRDRRIPCDVIYFDIDYMEDYRVFTWSKTRFPEPEKLLSDLTREGFAPIVIVDPGVAIHPGYEVYDAGMREDWFFLKTLKDELVVERVWPGEVHHPDFTHPRVREIWGDWQTRTLSQIGVAGIWNDMNEPAVFPDAGGWGTQDYPLDPVHYDSGHFRSHREVHNIYGLAMAQASTEAQRRRAPQSRPFTLTRSGWAGIQRHSAVWTGDNLSTFDSMPLDLMLNLSLGMSGVPFVGCDIGGFGHNATPELFARWMEWGVFQPFCRGHSAIGTIDQEPWAFGPETEKIARQMIQWRYQLIPYLYSVFVEASESGRPINRPLVLEYPGDDTVKSIGDQFLVGRDLLVAPLLEAGKDHRAVYLPAGEWVHWWSGERHAGGRWIAAQAPFGKPPLYARAGAILPLWPVRPHLKGAEPEETFLDVFAAHRMEGVLIEDDGVSLSYREGMECRTYFTGEEMAKGLMLTIQPPQGHYQPRRQNWTIRLHPTRPVSAIRCDGQAVKFEKAGLSATFSIKDARKAVQIEADYQD